MLSHGFKSPYQLDSEFRFSDSRSNALSSSTAPQRPIVRVYVSLAEAKKVGVGIGFWPQQLTGNCLCHPAYQLALQPAGPDVSGLWTQTLL